MGKSNLLPGAPVLPSPSELLELLPDTVFVVDEHGMLLFVGAGCVELLGYVPAELLGGYMIEYVHPDDRGTTLNAVWRIMSGSPVAQFRNRWVRKDGGVVAIDWSARWLPEHRVRVAVARRVVEE